MADEDNTEAVFDPSLKKKKKKKKTFDLDGAMEGQTENTTDNVEVVEDNKEIAEKEEEDLDLESFGKKKKKKKKVVEFEAEEKGAEDAGEKEVAEEEDIDLESFGKKKKKKTRRDEDGIRMDDLEEALPDDDEEDDLDLDTFGTKKKKKRSKNRTGDLDADDTNDGENKENETSDPWGQDDRDYTYDELLQRVFGIMRDKNPEMVAGEKKKFVMRPPQVVRVGTKKTAFVNFSDIAKMLHRQPKHLLAFLSAELGTVGAVDGNNQLIMKGRFQQKHIENVLRRYIKEYVTCHTCRSPDTILNKETRLFFLQCMTCHSRCSVQTIKTGFQAVTGKRSVMRAKQ